LHRSEGFGLTVAEAMLAGLPAIATDWSGNTDFLDANTGCLVGWRPVPAVDPQATYDFRHMTWAEPSVEDAAAALVHLRADPAAAHRLGARATARARAMLGPRTYAAVLSGLVVHASAHDAR
jgi:glycosyltransferase involved in cell wall biosynthesis